MNKLMRMQPKWLNKNMLWLSLFVLGNSLILTGEGSLTRTVGAMIVLLLPGLVWATLPVFSTDKFFQWIIGLGLSYVLMMIVGLLLHFIPGVFSIWEVLLLFNAITVGAMVAHFVVAEQSNPGQKPGRHSVMMVLLVIVVFGTLFRFVNLGYSEFDGDETKALIPAAESIEGYYDALFFQRKKGPGEILVPMLVWQLTGLVNELNVRVPFAVAGVLTILGTYLIGENLFSERVGLFASGLMALNGLMVAFSRIVQYQQIVVFMSILSILCVWKWRQEGKVVWGIVAGLFLGAGVLSHYDALLVIPALVYGTVAARKFTSTTLKAWGAATVSFLAVTTPFFAVYFLNPQLSRTTKYLGERIGSGLLKNQLQDFFHINSFYSSFYYVLLITFLALAFLVWSWVQLRWVRRLPAGKLIVSSVAVIFAAAPVLQPEAFKLVGLNVAFLPYTLLLLGAFFAPSLNVARRLVIVWLVTTFLGYNFLVASPRTHFYTILPPMILLASLSATWLWNKLTLNGTSPILPAAVSVFAAILVGGYLYHAYLRPTVQFEVDWPNSNLRLYWSPFSDAPGYDAYGFMHKSGWKAVGGLYAGGQLAGDYQTNGLTEKAHWYTRYQLQGCYRQSTQFFAVKHRLMDMREFPDYKQVGAINLPDHKGIDIYQPQSKSGDFGNLPVDNLNDIFNRTATASAFVRPVQVEYSADVNLADAIKLVGYKITNPQPYPGGQTAVSFFWQAQKDIPLDLDVFVHLESEGDPENVWGQSNGSPVCGEQSTSTWKVGSTVVDTHIINVSANAVAGTYKLVAGMYLPSEDIRVPIFDKAGNTIAESVEVAVITVKDNKK